MFIPLYLFRERESKLDDIKVTGIPKYFEKRKIDLKSALYRLESLIDSGTTFFVKRIILTRHLCIIDYHVIINTKVVLSSVMTPSFFTRNQINLFVSGWCFGEQVKLSVSVVDKKLIVFNILRK